MDNARVDRNSSDVVLTMNLPTVENVAAIKVVAYWRGSFIGMRPGQPPREWVWLGSPDWHGDMSPEQTAIAKDFYDANLRASCWYEGQWDVVPSSHPIFL